MNPHTPKLQQNQQHGQTVTEQNSTTQQSALEFSTSDEAIRHDAAQIALPPAIAERLRESIEKEPARPSGPWWKRFFGSRTD
jgi:hypothetical protein